MSHQRPRENCFTVCPAQKNADPNEHRSAAQTENDDVAVTTPACGFPRRRGIARDPRSTQVPIHP